MSSKNSYRIILVTPSQSINVTAGEHLGLAYIAAGLKYFGYNVEIIDGWLENLSSEKILNLILGGEHPLVVGFSSYASNMKEVTQIISMLKTQGVVFPFVAGGYGPTFHAEEYLREGFDFVIRGEGDNVFPQLCEYILNRNPPISEIPAVSYINQDNKICHNPPEQFSINLDSLPFPARDTIHFSILQKSPVNILSSKGCMGHCVYCSVHAFQNVTSKKWRQRSLENFVDEIEKIVSVYNVSHFRLVDDSLIEPPRDENWCKRFADEIEKRNLKIRLRGAIRANRVTDGIIRELKRAGFFYFSCGIENFASTALKRMGKGVTLDQNIQALEIFKKYGVSVEAGAILFDDSTTLEELWQNYNFMRQYYWTISKVFTIMYASHGTPFTRKILQKKIVTNEKHKLGNYLYPILDQKANLAYQALRYWSKYNIQLYDMSINPLRAKAISENEFELFYTLYKEIHKKELDILGNIFVWVKDGMPLAIIKKELKSYHKKNQNWYDNFEKRLKELYQLSDLVYKAKGNPFIC